MKEDTSDQVGSSSNADQPAPVPFLLEGGLRNRVAISGLVLSLSALLQLGSDRSNLMNYMVIRHGTGLYIA